MASGAPPTLTTIDVAARARCDPAGVPGGLPATAIAPRTVHRGRAVGPRAHRPSAPTWAAIASRWRSRPTCRRSSECATRCRLRRRAHPLPRAQVDLRNLALVPALSIRFGNDLRVGVAPGFLFSTGQLVVRRRTGSHSAAAPRTRRPRARYDIASGHGIGDAKLSVTLGGGDLLAPPRPGDRVRVPEPPDRQRRAASRSLAPAHRLGARAPGGRPSPAPAGQTARCVFGDIVVQAARHVHRRRDLAPVGPGLELTAMVRWLWLHVHDRIDVRLLGPRRWTRPGCPQHIVLYRGFKDVWDARVRVSYWWRERARVGAALRVETSAVPARAPSTRPRWTASSSSRWPLAEIRIARRFWLGAGYGVTFMPAVTVTDSVVRPEIRRAAAATRAATSPTEACLARLEGRARPTANGRYTADPARLRHDADGEVLIYRTPRMANSARDPVRLRLCRRRRTRRRGRAKSARPRARRGRRRRWNRRGRRRSRSRARRLGSLTAAKWRLAQRPGGRAAARPAATAGQLHDLVPRRFAPRKRGPRRDRPGAPVRTPDVHADRRRAPTARFDRAMEEVGGSANAMTYVRLHRVHRRHAPRRAAARGAAGGRPHGQPGPAREAGRDRTRGRRRGAARQRSRTASTGRWTR